MRILQIHVGMSLMGGVEGMICGLSNEMVRDNDVTVCSIFKPSEKSPFYERLDSSICKEHLGVEGEGFSFKSLWRVYRYISKTDADIIHIHGFFHYFAAPILLFHNKKKFVYTFHSDAFMENQKWEKRILWLKSFCLRKGWIHPVTISPQSQDSFSKLYHLESKLILNGIPIPHIKDCPNEIDQARKTQKTRVFFHAGRISRPKNQVALCEVFKRLIKEGNDVVLLIAGSCQDKEIYEELKPYFCDRIMYLGERNNVPDLFSRADGFCLPSIWEGLPLVLLEAMSVGCIPICSPVGGIVGIIHNGDNGILSTSSSAEDYYLAMKTFLSLSVIDIATMKEQAKKSFEPYDIKLVAKKYISYYKQLISNKQ